MLVKSDVIAIMLLISGCSHTPAVPADLMSCQQQLREAEADLLQAEKDLNWCVERVGKCLEALGE